MKSPLLLLTFLAGCDGKNTCAEGYGLTRDGTCLPLADTSSEADTDTDTDTDADTDTDTDVDTDTEPPPPPRFAFRGIEGGIRFSVNNAQVYRVGIAETCDRTDCWYGEDCVYGTKGYKFCHSDMQDKDTLVLVDSPDQIVEGETTLFSSANFLDATFMITDDRDSCWVVGKDPTYYDGLGCEVILLNTGG